MRTSLFTIVLGVLGVAGVAFAAKPDRAPAPSAQVDNMSIARMLFGDGMYDRAAVVLEQVDPADDAIDASEYWQLRGLVELRRNKFAEAADYLLAAISLGSAGPKTYLLRAQALVGAGQLAETVRWLEGVPKEVRSFPELYLLQGKALYELGTKAAAFQVVEEGFEAFPHHAGIARQRMFLLVELGLYQAAQEAMTAFLQEHSSEPSDYIAMAEALRRGGQSARARQLLEMANLRFADRPDIRTQLAVTYLDLGHPLVAAEILRPLAWLDASRAMHTAELYRRGGAYDRAIRMNQRVEDQAAKFRQRLSLLLDQEQFELAASLYPRLARLGLLEEQAIVYAMAYAFFKNHDFDQAERLLAQLTDDKLFREGVKIRREIDACRQATWQCD